ncbi:flagellar FliJ protein [Alteribacillus persepolensis]|uniref:Flagellar FliJ protein n=1 Tax=Alteribacillus persepolensis TaxID=568899 RepID=A0A1G7YNZ7_9BACI|nr:flagellar export protein FliJ [Alteribacillus persepolensis]SDG97939.1 flagellar FliJ protein [Alteribacillus persepolensis]
MSFQYSFQKILEVKESEKAAKEQEYQRTVTQFEEKATKLYELLKQKETMEAANKSKVKTGMTIQELQTNEQLVLQTDRAIQHIQQQTSQARNAMYQKELELQSASVEWKKYDKVKEWQEQEYWQESKKREEEQMDELSQQRFVLQQL